MGGRRRPGEAPRPGEAQPSGEPVGRVGAVVVNFDGGKALLDCVESLRRAGVRDVVVVDNESSDGSLVALAAVDDAVVLLPTGSNLGYGRAVNAGAKRLSNPYLLVANPDVVVDHDAPGLLAGSLDAEADLALTGPRLRYPDGGGYPSARSFPSFETAAAHAFLGLFWPGNRWSRKYRLERDDEATGAPPTRARDVDWVSGACFLVRRSAFESVGGFDERYFMYVEDLDLCWRLRRAGWRVRFLPEAGVVHDQGLSASRHPYRMIVAHHVSTWRFVVSSATRPRRPLLPVVGAGLAVRLALALGNQALGVAPRPGAPASRAHPRAGAAGRSRS